jgi:hypothetical protein
MRILLLSAAALAALSAYWLRARVDEPVEAASASPSALQSVPSQPSATTLAPFQVDLLRQAFEAAMRVPAYPHVKMRSELQERVVVAALELDQPALAAEFAGRMEGWRRGSAYGDIAYYHAKHGPQGEVDGLLELARAEVKKLDLQELAEAQGYDGDDEAVEMFQAWRRDRVRAKIARTCLELGQVERAIEFEAALQPSERGMVEVVRAERMTAEEVDAVVSNLETVVKAGTLEDIANGLAVSTVLAARFHADEVRGPKIRAALEAVLAKGPAMFRVDATLALASRLIDQGEVTWSQELVRSAVALLEEIPIAVEDDLPLRARAIELRHRVGDAGARKSLDALLGRFDAVREQIEPMTHADLLVPLAEAYAALGERAVAAKLYARAAEQGAVNVNAVPRTDDLVRVCSSMAVQGIEPSAELRARFEQTLSGLTDPW